MQEFEFSATSGFTGNMDCDNGKRSRLPVEESNACAIDEDEYPIGTMRFDRQVAGHLCNPKKNKLGMLRGVDGRVLKSCEKPLLRDREISFYESIDSDDPIYRELSGFVPKYCGTMDFSYKNKPIKFIVMKDVTEGMTEPCVMDIKIGKRTWDPLADEDKRRSDDRKYAASKKAYGFCIPGFQFYSLASGELRKFNKDYGKLLDAVGVINALRMFLNAEKPGFQPYNELVSHILSQLRDIHAFFRKQTKLRFYSSSLLIVYDANRLRSYIRTSVREVEFLRGLNKRGKTFSSCENGLNDNIESKKIEKRGKIILPKFGTSSAPASPPCAKNNRIKAFERLNNRLKRSSSLTGCDFGAKNSTPFVETKVERSGSYGRDLDLDFKGLCRTHSLTNNYDHDIKEMKEDYATLLEKLTGNTRKAQDWIRVKMIDFTHVFLADDDKPDLNYLVGIENLIKILERFLQ